MARLFTIPPGSENDPANPHLRRNFIVNTLDSASFYFGETFAAYQTILPVFAATLTNSPVLIGLVPAINDAGWFLPQLFFAPYLQRISRKLPLVRALALVERLPYFFLILAALWLPKLPGNTAIILFLLLIAWKGLAAGLVGLPWQELIATVIPVWLRGRFFGVSHFLGKLSGLGSAAIAGVILSRLVYPQNYALVFLLSFIGVMVSYFFLILTVEPETLRPPQPEAVKTAFSAQLWSILKEDSNFRRYIYSRALWFLGSMASGFVAVYGIQRFNLPDAYAAIFTSVLVGFSTLGFIIWGALGDRFGHKFVLIGGALLWVGALAILLLVPAQWALYLAFALIGLSQPGNTIGDLNLAMEFDSGPRRPAYIGLVRTLTAPVLLIAPVLAGAVVSWSSYPVMFVFSFGFSVCSLALLLLGVTDPRKIKPNA